MQRSIIAGLLAFGIAATAPAFAALSSDDASFVQSADHEALGEYALAALARGKAESPAAKSLATEVATDSTQASDFIRTFAKTNDVAIDDKPSLRADTQYGEIQSDTGSSFDRGFARSLRIDATIAESDYQDEAAHGSNPQLRSFAKHELEYLEKVVSAASKIAP
ncbi:MAG TPA: DUF4142 domain-containing protein [Candidatus Acidoferrales bacterium]|nr:DUF4142 domain-containing protein [Candidatus Acidoferrales bacterium]